MPAYDFVCETCKNEFEIRISMEEYSKGVIKACPLCGSERIQQKFTPFQVLSGKVLAPPGGSCCGPRSGGCR